MPVLSASVTRFQNEDNPHLSARRVAETLDITLTDLAALAGIARNTLTASGGTRTVDQALSPVVRILTMAEEMTGGQARAALWFKHQPVPGWAGKTAFDLVRDGKADKVTAYLEAVRARASMPEGERIASLVLWRAYVPRWAHDPLSGVGAARFGGRWNALGGPCALQRLPKGPASWL